MTPENEQDTARRKAVLERLHELQDYKTPMPCTPGQIEALREMSSDELAKTDNSYERTLAANSLLHL